MRTPSHIDEQLNKFEHAVMRAAPAQGAALSRAERALLRTFCMWGTVGDDAEQALTDFERILSSKLPGGLGAALTRPERELLRTFYSWRAQPQAAQTP